MRSTEAAKIVDVSTQTIRDWSDRYAEFLSPSARPEKGEIRDFTEDDIRVLLTIKRDADRRLTPEEMIRILQSGDRVAEIPDPVESEEEVPASEHAMALAKINALQRELSIIREEHNREVNRLLDENKELKTDRDEAFEELGKRDQAIADYRHKIGYLEGQIEQLKERLVEAKNDDRPRRRGLFGN